MNDLYRSNGKRGHAIDLGLRTTQDLNVKWPTPHQLAAKRDTYPLTFRIDEIAYASLGLLAKQCGMSINNFVNELINSYINQNQNLIEGAVFTSALNSYLDRLYLKLDRMSDAEIIRAFRLPDVKMTLKSRRIEFPRDPQKQDLFLENFYRNMLDAGYGGTPFVDIMLLSDNVYLQLVPDNHEAALLNTKDWTSTELNSVSFADYVLTIPLSKWVLVSTILFEYSHKAYQFTGCTNRLDENRLRRIIEITNQYYKRQELSYNLVDTLRLPETVWGEKNA